MTMRSGKWPLQTGIRLLACIGIISLLPRALGPLLANVGIVAYVHVVNDSVGSYPPHMTKDGNLVTAVQYGKRAVDLTPSNPIPRWQLGRAALAAADYDLATEALDPLVAKAQGNVFLYTDIVVSAGRANQPEKVIALYKQYGNPTSQAIVTDTVAVAYLQLAEQLIETGEMEAAAPFLGSVIELRPGDLYANYYQMWLAQERGDQAAVKALRHRLTHFPIEAIWPADERLVTFSSEVIPELISSGIWDKDLGLNVLAFLVWQETDTAGVEQLARTLAYRYPQEADWRFYLAELYQRAGRLNQATTEYQRILREAPSYFQVYFRLGDVCEAQASQKARDCTLHEALRWYQRYRQAVPDDLAGLKKLVDIETILRQVEPDLLTAWAASTDDRSILATMLEVPLDAVRIGPNLVESGSFEEWVYKKPKGWAWSDMATGHGWNAGVFAGGADELVSWDGMSVQINGLWLEHDTSLEPGRWGLRWIHQTALEPQSTYLISFFYRTSRTPDNTAAMWVGDQPSLSFYHGDYRLPSTGGEWRRFIAVGENQSISSFGVAPILRSFSPGQVWFDNFEIRQVFVEAPPSVTPPRATLP